MSTEMTTTATEARSFDRLTFVKGTGALVVAIGAPSLLNPKAAPAAVKVFRSARHRST